MSKYSEEMRNFAEKTKAKRQEQNQKLFDSAVESVKTNQEKVKASWEEFVRENEKLCQMQKNSNEGLFHKDLEIAQQRIAVDRDVEDTKKAFEALRAELGIDL